MSHALLALWSEYGSEILFLGLLLYILRMYLYLKNKLQAPKMHFYNVLLLAALGPIWIVYWIMRSSHSHVLLFSFYIVMALCFCALGVKYAVQHKLMWNPVNDTLWVPSVFYKTTAFLLVPVVILLAIVHIWFKDLAQHISVILVFLLGKSMLSGFYIGGAAIYIWQAAKEKYIILKD